MRDRERGREIDRIETDTRSLEMRDREKQRDK